MPSHVGSYNEKGDPDNYIHPFEDLPTTYKGLMDKTYTLVKEKEVATNEAPNDHQENFDIFKKNSSWDDNKGKKNRDRYAWPKKMKIRHTSSRGNECSVTEGYLMEGPFLGHLITKKGIKAKPSKVKEIFDLAALSRFHSRGADKALLLLKMLKNYTNKKIVQWTAKGEEAFQKMKEFIETVPMLMTPIKGKTLVMYLAASMERISAVLLVERGKTSPYLLHKQDTTRGRIRLPRATNTHNSPRVRCKEASKIVLSSPY
nr:hypothetical protein [Tanacetum cinerariifolium]